MKEYLAAIETGGTKLQMVLGNEYGDILYRYRARIHPEAGRNGILQQIIEAFPLLRNEAERQDAAISKIGVGFGGPVATANGITLWSAQVDGWKDFPLAAYLKEKTGIPSYVFNDSNAAAWGEYCRGTGNHSRVFFYTNMGSGVGGGVVIDGRLFDGQGTGAAEFGQTYLYNSNRINGCRFPVNHLEKVCSGWGIEQRIRSDAIPSDSILNEMAGSDPSRITAKMWGEAVKKKDPYSIQILDEISEYFAIGLCNVICFFSPEIIAIGGGVSLIGDPLISRIRHYVDQYVYTNNRGNYQILKSQLDEDVVLVGTLLLASKQ